MLARNPCYQSRKNLKQSGEKARKGTNMHLLLNQLSWLVASSSAVLSS
jgi:hypothetical protein